MRSSHSRFISRIVLLALLSGAAAPAFAAAVEGYLHYTKRSLELASFGWVIVAGRVIRTAPRSKIPSAQQPGQCSRVATTLITIPSSTAPNR